MYSVVERDIFTCRENEVSSVRSNLQYVLQVNSRISANKWKSIEINRLSFCTQATPSYLPALKKASKEMYM